MAATGKTLDILALEHECFEAELNGGCAPYSSLGRVRGGLPRARHLEHEGSVPGRLGHLSPLRGRPGLPQGAASAARPSSDIGIPGFPTPTMKHEFWCTAIESHYPDGTDGPELAPWLHESEALPYYEEPEHGTGDATPQPTRSTPSPASRAAASRCTSTPSTVSFPGAASCGPCPSMEINPDDRRGAGPRTRATGCGSRALGARCARRSTSTTASRPGTINAEHQWWYPELGQADRRLRPSPASTASRTATPRTSTTALPPCAAYPVKVYKATAENSPVRQPGARAATTVPRSSTTPPTRA